MSKQELNTDLFDRYLRHELSGAELAQFDENLLNEDAFNAEFIAYKTIALGIGDYGKVELKNYLKANAKTIHHHGSFKISRMVFALAAVLIIFAGLYIVITYYVSPDKVLNIATNQEIKNEIEVSDTFAIAGNETLKEDHEAPPSPDIRSEIEIPPPAEISKDEMAVIVPTFADDRSSGAGAPALESSQSNKYNVLSDFKISDTVLFAMNFDGNDEKMSRIMTKDKTTDSKKSIPGTNNGNNNNRYESRTETDSLKTKKKELINKADKYTIEFWLSPVNFKGYKMLDKTVQLFGFAGKNVKLVNYNSRLYLTNGMQVYVLTPCPDGCTYKTEPDEEIVKLIIGL